MKKFKFSLQTVHNVREMRREKEEFVLSQHQAEAARITGRIAELEQMHTAAIEKYTGKMHSGAAIDINEVELERNHISELDHLIRQTRAQLETQKNTCRQQTQVVAAAMQQVKITERLRDAQKSRHALETERAEQSALDELVSAGFTRRMS